MASEPSPTELRADPNTTGPQPSQRRANGRIPVPPTRFVGRRSEVELLCRLVAGSALVTAIGPGGCGKTRLAMQVGLTLAEEFPGGVWWVDLQQLPANQPVAPEICAALGLREQPGLSVVDLLRRYAKAGATLVILDNCEHLLSSCAEVLAELTGAGGGLRFLATSREALLVPGEQVWPVPSMPVPRWQAPFSAVARSDAVRLFTERARAVRPDFRLDESNADAVRRICARLDGLPLAIELAAAQSPAFGPAELALMLDDSLGMLTRGSRAGQSRHRTLRASVEWSVALLGDDERLLLSRLAVFESGFTLAAAQQVCADVRLELPDIVHVLAALVHKSLVAVDDSAGRRRFRLLETTRQYAGERLVAAREHDAVRMRQLAYLRNLVGREPVSAASVHSLQDWLDEVDWERRNIRSALDWAVAVGDRDTPLVLGAGLGILYGTRGGEEGRRFLADCLSAGDAAPSPTRARALWAAGYAAFVAADVPTAFQFAGAALEMARGVEDIVTVARTLTLFGGIDATREPGNARPHLIEAAGLAREGDDVWCRAQSLGHVALSWTMQGEIERARESLAEAEEAVELVGLPQFLAWHYVVTALVALRAGELAEAEEMSRRARGLAAPEVDPVTIAMSVAFGAEIEIWRGRAEGALADTEAADRAYDLSENGPFVAMFIEGAVGHCALALGRLDEALPSLESALRTAELSGRAAVEAQYALDLAEIALLNEDTAAARALLDRAARLGRSVDDARIAAEADVGLGRVAMVAGRLDEARSLVCGALAVHRGRGYRLEAVRALEVLADVFVRSEDQVRAARLFGAATAARHRLGAVRSPVDRSRHRAGRTTLTRFVDHAALRGALRQGAVMSLDEAVEYALRGRGIRSRVSTGWESLTPTELKITELVAAGHSNPEIAQQIFVSRATVKAHLARVFAKTGVANRAELAAGVARRRGRTR